MIVLEFAVILLNCAGDVEYFEHARRVFYKLCFVSNPGCFISSFLKSGSCASPALSGFHCVARLTWNLEQSSRLISYNAGTDLCQLVFLDLCSFLILQFLYILQGFNVR